MKPVNLTRLTIGVLIIVGLLLFRPLAYFVGAMMIFAGLTGICLLETLFSKIFGVSASCSLGVAANASSPAQSDLQSMSAGETNQAIAEK